MSLRLELEDKPKVVLKCNVFKEYDQLSLDNHKSRFHVFDITFTNRSKTFFWDYALKLPLKREIKYMPVEIHITSEVSHDQIIVLPQGMAQNIIDYLTGAITFRNMNCFLFAAGVTIRPWMNKKEILYKGKGKHSESDADLDVFKPVDVIDDKKVVHHCAVYIGNGFFLDKMGHTPFMSLRTREQLLDQYKGTHIVGYEVSVECDSCRRKENKVLVMQVCSGCKVTMYCGRECQKKHWKVHKLACKTLSSGEVKKYVKDIENRQGIVDELNEKGQKVGREEIEEMFKVSDSKTTLTISNKQPELHQVRHGIPFEMETDFYAKKTKKKTKVGKNGKPLNN